MLTVLLPQPAAASAAPVPAVSGAAVRSVGGEPAGRRTQGVRPAAAEARPRRGFPSSGTAQG